MKRRSCAITFRVDSGEYNDLAKAVGFGRARSMSELVRLSITNQIAASERQPILGEYLDDVDQLLAPFEEEMHEFQRYLRRVLRRLSAGRNCMPERAISA